MKRLIMIFLATVCLSSQAHATSILDLAAPLLLPRWTKWCDEMKERVDQ